MSTMGINRAQLRYRGPKVKTQADMEAKFRAWQRGELVSGKFDLMVWGKTQKRIEGKNPGFLTLGQMGKVKMYGDGYTALVDIDRRRAPTLTRVFRVVRTIGVGVSWVRLDRSSSGRWHVLVRFKRRFSPLQLVAIQALFGSDWKRESFNLYRLLSGVKSERWNFLFEEKLK